VKKIAAKVKRARGRPRRIPGSKTLSALGFRPSPDTRARLVAAATAAGHSLSAEVDRRLQFSFWSETERQRQRDDAYGGAHNRTLGFVVARIAAAVEHECGNTWRSDAKVLAEVATAIVFLLQKMQAFEGSTMPLPMKHDQLNFDDRWDACTVSREQSNADPPWWFVTGMLASNVRLGRFAWPLVAVMREHEHLHRATDELPPTEMLRSLFPAEIKGVIGGRRSRSKQKHVVEPHE
jgi:hypothetical protein